MVTHVIDGKNMTDRAKAHDELKRSLGLSEHYGRNLDALWDEVSVMNGCVTLENANALIKNLGAYGEKIIRVLEEAGQVNSGFLFERKSALPKNAVIHEKLASYIQNGDIAGAGLIVRKGSEIVHEEYAGYADINAGIPVGKRSLFRLASMSKPVCACAIMLLAQEGKLCITDRVSKYLPEFGDMLVCAGEKEYTYKNAADVPLKKSEKPLLIEDLLRHRSGLGHGGNSMLFGVDNRTLCRSLAERADMIARMPLDFEPGWEAGYSGVTAFDVLGRIVEVVSDTPFERFLAEEFFDRLGMPDTTFWPNSEQAQRTVRLYGRESGVLSDVYAPGEVKSPFLYRYPSGSAGLFGTLSDYDAFVSMLSGRTKGILKEETLRLMTARDTKHCTSLGAWGLGMFVFNGRSVSGRGLSNGSFGWSGAFGTHFYVDPVNDVTMVLMANRNDIGGSDSYVSHGLERAVFEGLGLQEG